jgi:hypothetical protein
MNKGHDNHLVEQKTPQLSKKLQLNAQVHTNGGAFRGIDLAVMTF